MQYLLVSCQGITLPPALSLWWHLSPILTILWAATMRPWSCSVYRLSTLLHGGPLGCSFCRTSSLVRGACSRDNGELTEGLRGGIGPGLSVKDEPRICKDTLWRVSAGGTYTDACGSTGRQARLDLQSNSTERDIAWDPEMKNPSRRFEDISPRSQRRQYELGQRPLCFYSVRHRKFTAGTSVHSPYVPYFPSGR